MFRLTTVRLAHISHLELPIKNSTGKRNMSNETSPPPFNLPRLLRADQFAEVVHQLIGPDPRKVDTSGVSYAAWVSVADVSASKSLGARRLHQECRLRVL